jgi:hypothetical protein
MLHERTLEHIIEFIKLYLVFIFGWRIGFTVQVGNVMLSGVFVAYLIWLGMSKKEKVL